MALLTLLALVAGAAGAAQHQLVLVDPVVPIGGSWSEMKFGMPTRYRLSTVEGVSAIEARGRGTASGLIRDARFRVRDYPRLEWSWRVDRLPSDADIKTKAGDDVGASLFLIFGRNPPRSFMRGPAPRRRKAISSSAHITKEPSAS